MKNPNIVIRPLCADNCQIERVSSYKLSRVGISQVLKWNHHIAYLVTQASKRLYALRLLKRAVRIPEHIILFVYRSSVLVYPKVWRLAKYPWVPL